jgi:hypothetical protein
MNQAEQSFNPAKVLTVPRQGTPASSASCPKAQSLTGMLRLARETARTEDFVWGILSAATLVILLVSVWL